jgi:hypothetical protein
MVPEARIFFVAYANSRHHHGATIDEFGNPTL